MRGHCAGGQVNRASGWRIEQVRHSSHGEGEIIPRSRARQRVLAFGLRGCVGPGRDPLLRSGYRTPSLLSVCKLDKSSPGAGTYTACTVFLLISNIPEVPTSAVDLLTALQQRDLCFLTDERTSQGEWRKSRQKGEGMSVPLAFFAHPIVLLDFRLYNHVPMCCRNFSPAPSFSPPQRRVSPVPFSCLWHPLLCFAIGPFPWGAQRRSRSTDTPYNIC